MTDGYVEIKGDIASKRGQISQRREQLARPVVSGTAKQRRIAMRRVVRTPEHKTYVKAKKKELGALGEAEQSISEYESKVKKYEGEGYDVAKTSEGDLQFSKTIQKKVVTRKAVSVPKVSQRIRWTENGVEKSVLTHNINVERHRRTLESRSGVSNIRIESLAAPQSRHYKYTVRYEPVTTTQYEKTPELKYLLQYADFKQKVELQKAITYGPKEGARPEGFIGPIQPPIYPAMTKAYESLTPIEKTIYNKKFDVVTTTVKAPQKEIKVFTAGEQLIERYGGERLDLYAAKHIQDWGIPAAIAGWQLIADKVFGVDPKRNAWKNLTEQYAGEILESTRRKGESVGDYTGRFWTSPQAITNVYLPVATLGLGYAVKPFTIGLKSIPVTSKLFPITSRAVYYGSKYQKVITGVSLSAIGGVTAYQVATAPDSAPLILGRTAASFGKMIGGYQVGGKLYGATHTKLIQESYWTGTQYEQNILESMHRQSVISSQYKPYEFGTPSTRYTGVIRPSIPKTPQQVHTMTLGIRDPLDPGKGFFIKKPIVSSTDFSVYETHPVTVMFGKKGYTINMFSGETTIKGGAPVRTIGFGSGRYAGDVVDDVMVSRMYSYSISDIAFKPTIMRGTSLSKTYYGGSAEWTGGKIKFFTPGRESDITRGFSIGRVRGVDMFDISRVVKPSVEAKSYFGDPGGFDYNLPPKLIDDVILPGGFQTDASMKIDLPSMFDSLATKQISPMSYDTGVQVSSYWKGVSPAVSTTQSLQPLSIVSGIQKIGTIPVVKTMQVNVNLSRDIQNQLNIPLSITKTSSASLSASRSLSASITKQLQLQRQRQQTQLKQITVTQPAVTPFISPGFTPPYQSTSYIYNPPPVEPTPPPPKPPPIYFYLPEGKPKRKRKKKTMDGYGKGYRFRSWKVPTMKQLIGINNMGGM